MKVVKDGNNLVLEIENAEDVSKAFKIIMFMLNKQIVDKNE
ncbi:MAG: hypothetical protein QXL51_01510 [Candidatus Aenigmatarchaeota archaeon]